MFFRLFAYLSAIFATIVALSHLLGATSSHDGKPGIAWGINGHPFASYPGVPLERQLDYIQDLGLTSYRVDIADMSKAPALAELVAMAKLRGIAILPVLTPGIDLSAEDAGTIHKRAYDFAHALVSQFKADIRVFELGNELENYAIIQPCEKRDDGTQYNCGWGAAGGAGPLDYYGPRWAKVSAYLKGLSEGAMAADPSVRKAIGTAGWGHLGAFERMRQDGIAWDISVWHLYGDDPEWAFKKLVSYGHPIWVTEFNHPKGSQQSADGQAEGLTRWMTRLNELAQHYPIEAAHIYELMDETYWAPDMEAYMGLVHLVKSDETGWRPGLPKPAYDAVKRFIRGETPLVPSRRCDLSGFDLADRSAANQVNYGYCLILGRPADGSGYQSWVRERENGMSASEMLNGLIQSEEFAALLALPTLSHAQFLKAAHQWLGLGVIAEPELAVIIARLEGGELNRGMYLQQLLASPEFLARHRLH